MNIKIFSAFLAIATILLCLAGSFNNNVLASDETGWASQEKVISTKDSLNLPEPAGEQILVVVKDFLGNENYSKVIIVNELNNSVINPSKRLAAGVYYVIASSHSNRLYNQRIIVE